jgi:uncharacterized membrane protein YczE
VKRVDLNGIAVGVTLGVPMTIYQNPANSLAEHIAFVLGVVLFCWAAGRFIAFAANRP